MTLMNDFTTFWTNVIILQKVDNTGFANCKQTNTYMRPGATKGTLRRKNENSFFDVLCLLNSTGHFKIKFSFLVQFLTQLWLLQCLKTRYQNK